MRNIFILTICLCVLSLISYSQVKNCKSVTVPIILDHNRMLVDAEMQKKDGSWRRVRFWIDSGSPDFFISESLARDLGINMGATEDSTFNSANLEITTSFNVRVGGMDLNFQGVKSMVKFQPFWLFSTMHSDGNLPSTVLEKYHIVFDYTERQLTIAEPGSIKPRGLASPAHINHQTGIIQLDATIDGNKYSFALDMGASYSFVSEGILTKILDKHPGLTKITGTLGCANMWGWWPENEQLFTLVRIPEIQWGNVALENVGIVGVPDFHPSRQTLGEWYSQKTAMPVEGFLGSNVLLKYRLEIDYMNSLVYFEKGAKSNGHEMDMVGISVRQLSDYSYQVVGVVNIDGKPSIEGVEPGDIITQIDTCQTKGATMGSVVDMLRGKMGDKRVLLLKRNGKRFKIEAQVEHFL
jgi:hypothetical protein